MATPETEHRDPEADAIPDDADTLADELTEQADIDPDHESTAKTEPSPHTPFYSVSGRGPGTVSVRAGWLTAAGDVHSLAIDATVGVEQAGAAQQLALGWYQRMLGAIYSQAAAGEDEGEAGDEDGDAA